MHSGGWIPTFESFSFGHFSELYKDLAGSHILGLISRTDFSIYIAWTTVLRRAQCGLEISDTPLNFFAGVCRFLSDITQVYGVVKFIDDDVSNGQNKDSKKSICYYLLRLN